MHTNEQLLELWTVDCRIDKTKLLDRMYSHPVLHSKYLTILQEYKLKQRSLTLKYQKLRHIKIRYYNGELTKEELDKNEWKQYLFKKPMKSEMESLLDADVELQMLQEQILYIETLVSATESIMKELTNQHFLLKTIVEREKFEAGI